MELIFDEEKRIEHSMVQQREKRKNNQNNGSWI